jgi:hypothetical protein
MGSKMVLFAEDTNILVSGENLNTLQYKLNWTVLWRNFKQGLHCSKCWKNGNIFPYDTE